MKKNITINLFGSLYSIDEDAYELLEKYLDNIKRYFKGRDGGDEIADDIEHRVAELFEEIKDNGAEAISIEDVQAIIKRIGNPEEMGEDEDYSEDEHNGSENVSSFQNNSDKPKRKLYRNPDDQVLGGVLSGLCTYFGGNDPLPWRIIFIVIAILSQIIPFFIVYLVAWALIPAAETAEDKLRMKGKPVNVDTLNEEIMTDAENVPKRKSRGVFNTLVTIIGFCLKLFIGFIIGLLLLVFVIVMICLAVGVITPISLTGGMLSSVESIALTNTIMANHSIVICIWGSLISSILFLGIIFYSLVHSIVKKNSGESMSNTTRISLVIISFISIIASIMFGVYAYNKLDDAVSEYDKKENTINGIYLEGRQHERLAENGWELITYKNADSELYRRTSDFVDDNCSALYFSFRRKETGKDMLVDLQKTEDYPEGSYHIEGIALARCNGSYLYAKSDSITKATVMIPVDDGNGNGNMHDMTNEELMNTTFFNFDPDNELWSDEGFKERISDWSYVRSASFHHKGGPLKYGVTNIGSRIGLKDNTTPAWRFVLMKIKIVADNGTVNK